MRNFQNETADIDISLTPNQRFMQQALARFAALPVGWTGLSELWRVFWDLKPPSPNCWGGFISYLKKTGRVVATGERRMMATPRSHNRKTDVLRKVS
jgi:hypothetical protein